VYTFLRDTSESKEARVKRILDRRHIFHWLPVAHENDLVHGSWWFVYGSILTTIIPIVPLISLFIDFWDDPNDVMPWPNHTAVYALLSYIGVWFTVGSWVFVRAFREPAPPPLLSYWYLANDELLGSWLFLFGTAPAVPVMVLFVLCYPDYRAYKVALTACVLATVLFFAFIIFASPTSRQDFETREREKIQTLESLESLHFLAPYVKRILPQKLHSHVTNDWIIVCWLMLIGSIICTFVSIAYAVYLGLENDNRGVYNWALSSIDMVIYSIGCFYLVAGSYQKHLVGRRFSLSKVIDEIVGESVDSSKTNANNKNSPPPSPQRRTSKVQDDVESAEGVVTSQNKG